MVRARLIHPGWLLMGAALGLGSQLTWLALHGWPPAWWRLAAGAAGGALVVGPLLRLGAWALAPLAPWARDTLRALLGLDTRAGRRFWLGMGLALLVAAGVWSWFHLLRPWVGSRLVRDYFLAHAAAESQGLTTVFYSSLDQAGPAKELGVARAWSFPDRTSFPGGRQTEFVIRWLGVLQAPESGFYRLGGVVDDGLVILVDGRRVAADWREAPPRPVWGKVWLWAGPHALEVRYRQLAGGASLRLLWQPPGGPQEPLPARVLRPLRPGTALGPITRLRLRWGLVPRASSTYPPFEGGRFWRLPWYGLH